MVRGAGVLCAAVTGTRVYGKTLDGSTPTPARREAASTAQYRSHRLLPSGARSSGRSSGCSVHLQLFKRERSLRFVFDLCSHDNALRTGIPARCNEAASAAQGVPGTRPLLPSRPPRRGSAALLTPQTLPGSP